MEKIVSKAGFKPKALEYFRLVEETGIELIITDRGRPVANRDSVDSHLVPARARARASDQRELPRGVPRGRVGARGRG